MRAQTAALDAAAYAEHGRIVGRRALEIAGILAILLSVVFGAVHDRQFTGEPYAQLLTLRIVHALGVAAVIGALWTAWGRANVWVLAFAATMLGAVTVLLMMPWSGGHASPYFGGLGLVLLGSALLYPSPVRWTVASVVAIPLAYGAYVAWVPGEPVVIVRNVVGLVATAAIALVAALPRERLRWREFVARRAAERARNTATRALLTAQREGAVTAGLSCAGREMLELPAPELVYDRLCLLGTRLLAADAALVLTPSMRAPGWTVREANVARPLDVGLPPGSDVGCEVIEPLLPALQRGGVVWCARPAHALLLERLGAASALAFALRDGGKVVAVQLVVFAELSAPPVWAARRLARGLANLASLALARARVVEDLAESRRSTDTILAALSHGLRTPLNVIVGLAEMAADTDDLAESRELLGGVRRAAERLSTLVGDLLAARDVSLAPTAAPAGVCPVPVLVRDLQRRTARLRPAPGVRVEWPARVPALAVRCRSDELATALFHLLVNGLQCTRRGFVRLDVERRGNAVRFAVRDTGIGVAPEDRERIFELFRQGEHREEEVGLGVGLYVARRTVEMLGGTLELDSQPGAGSTFVAVLPLATGLEASPDPREHAA